MLLRNGQPGRNQGGARMRAGIGKGQIVLFERMSHRAMRQRGGRRTDSRSSAENCALATLAHPLSLGNDHLPPGELCTKQDRRHGVRNAILSALKALPRNLLVATPDS